MAEIKKTEVVADNELAGRAGNFWERHGKKLLIGAGVVLVALIAFVAYREFVQKPNQEKAAEAMFRAQEYFNQDSVRLALNGDNVNPGFLKIIDRYSGTPAANLAHFYAGSCYMKMGDFNKAVNHLQDFSTDSKQVQARAYALLGDAYSEQGKREDAAKQYEKAGKHFEEDDYNSPEYLFRAGYLYESMGKNKEAIDMYRLIKDKYARTERGNEIDKYLARLGSVEN
jgi:tetratricopeptide (TPR) repeat protein